MDKITREWSDNFDDDISRIDRDVGVLFETVNQLLEIVNSLQNNINYLSDSHILYRYDTKQSEINHG